MTHVSPEDMATKLPELLQQLRGGGAFLLEVEGKVVAKVSPIFEPAAPPYREPGFAKGRFWVSEDFDEPLEDFKPYM
jgi:antitoxin (DNA-binding transcriptional repressor) of toxin-antitoxin stability system